MGSTVLEEALLDSPLLTLFICPWTLCALWALCYVEGCILVSFVRNQSVVQLVSNIVGFVLTAPWLLLAGKAALSVAGALTKNLSHQRGLGAALKGIKLRFDAWIPNTAAGMGRVFAAILIWSVASFPFTILVTQLLEDRKFTIALFLSLMLSPYWLLALGGSYVLIVGCLRQCCWHRHSNYEHVQAVELEIPES